MPSFASSGRLTVRDLDNLRSMARTVTDDLRELNHLVENIESLATMELISWKREHNVDASDLAAMKRLKVAVRNLHTQYYERWRTE